jgi:hypothetical protein
MAKMTQRPSHEDNRKNSKEEDLALARSLWPDLREPVFREEQYRHVLDGYSSDARKVQTRFGLAAEDTLKAMEVMSRAGDTPQNEISPILGKTYSKALRTDTANRTLEMILRHWTMLDIRIDDFEPDTLTWHANTTINETIRQYFQTKLGHLQEYQGAIDGSLTAASLVADRGARIVWTNNILEHLSWNRQDRKLKVFEHKIWVRNHLRYQETSPIRGEVLEELLLTLNLLFPTVDSPTETLLAKDGMLESFYGLGYCGRGRTLDWSKYRYWRPEIQALVAELDQPPPGLKQFYHAGRENRNLLNLTLFWLSGVAVVFLTVVASVCSIMSVIYSRESRDLAALQLQLSLLQTCNDTGPNDQLLEFCYKQRLWRS